MQSNSLVPYELEAIEAAEPAPGGGGAQLVLRLKRGARAERMAVHVERKPAGGFGLKSFAPA